MVASLVKMLLCRCYAADDGGAIRLRATRMTALPTGTVTFLFTDIEGSTRLIEAQPAAYRAALARHDAIIERVIADHGGIVFKRAGDSFDAAFFSPTDAARAALAGQQALLREPWGETGPIQVRMALHTGEV